VWQLVIAIAFPGFNNNFGRSVTHIFLLMDHFLYRFSTFSKKNEENLSTRSLNFLQNAPSNSVRLSLQRFQMPREKFSFLKLLGSSGIELFTQQAHFYKI